VTRRLWLTGMVAVAAAGCAHGMPRSDGLPPTLEVHNQGPVAVDLRVVMGVTVEGDTIGFALGTVFAGTTECFRLQEHRLHTSGGTTYTPMFLAGTRNAWRLNLRGYPSTDRLALEPADQRCTPGQHQKEG
jgi:hypothetical protein